MKIKLKTANWILPTLVLALTVVGISQARAVPAEVLIVRHGEKASDSHLSARGYDRANALADLFTTDARFLNFGTPVALYASLPGKADGSVRSIETVTPLSQKLGLMIDKDFKRDDVNDLVNDIMNDESYDQKTVLIAWPHDAIPAIAEAFGVKAAPQDWPSDVFDRVWKIDFSGEKPVSFEDLPQNVLPGDSAK